jgi:hypothetical protein
MKLRIIMNNLILRVDIAFREEGFFTQMYVDNALLKKNNYICYIFKNHNLY